jgi:hypothetical protein
MARLEMPVLVGQQEKRDDKQQDGDPGQDHGGLRPVPGRNDRSPPIRQQP